MNQDASFRRAGAPLLVLVLDDEDCVRSTIEVMLRRSGLEPLGARTGREALEKIAAAKASGRPVDIAIVDLSLPGGETGESVLRQLFVADPSLRAIATSGDIEHPIMTAPASAGFSACLAKPFSLADLTAALRSLTDD
jgi:CheY-like chemotaxis protein